MKIRQLQAQDLLRSIVNNPTDLVSKAQAQILLAQTEAMRESAGCQRHAENDCCDGSKAAGSITRRRSRFRAVEVDFSSMLGRLRLDADSSRGRRYPEPPHPYRNDFQRDRDRIVHSRAFRRMEGKTQVFAAGLCDHFRNRLTHTIEVSQVARTVALTLDLNEEYTETLALAHDLGHPPFGHVGEKELDRQMCNFGAGLNTTAMRCALWITWRTTMRASMGSNLTLRCAKASSSTHASWPPTRTIRISFRLIAGQTAIA